MSKEYIPPAVLLSAPAEGIGASVSSRKALSAPASCPWLLFDWPPPLLLFPWLLSPACPADRTSEEASNPIPRNLPHRAIGTHTDVPGLLSISSSPVAHSDTQVSCDWYLWAI